MKIDIMHDYGIELIAETENDKELLNLFHRKGVRVTGYDIINHKMTIEKNLEKCVLINTRDSREIIAINTYKKVLQLVEELHHHSNATETTFLIDIEIFLKNKIDYYESGGT